MKKLWRTKQCEKCPWKKNTDPNEIPNGYSKKKHENLKNTIADEGIFRTTLRAMSCHESRPKDESPYCIGWLMNQLGPGNNIGLRMRMLDFDLSEVEFMGEQHERFEDTLPKSRRSKR